MSLLATALPRHQCFVQRTEMAWPDVLREASEVGKRIRFLEQEVRQPPVSLAQIAGGTGGHYVAAGVVPAARLRLDVIDGECLRLELFAAVHAAPVVSGEDFLALHDVRDS